MLILSNEYMQRPKFEIHRLRKSDVTDDPSYCPHRGAESGTGGECPHPGCRDRRWAGPCRQPGNPHKTHTGARGSSGRSSGRGTVQKTPADKTGQGFFGMLFTKLFASGPQEQTEPAKKAAPVKAAPEKPAPKSGSAVRSDQKPESDDESQQSKPAEKEGSRRSRGGRRRSKKKQTQAGDDRGRPQGQKKAKRKPRKKATRKKTSPARDTGGPAQPPEGGEAAPQQPTKSSGGGQQVSANDGGPEQKSESPPRKSRRRRSPYQTSGAKQRDDQPEKADAKSGRIVLTHLTHSPNRPTPKPPSRKLPSLKLSSLKPSTLKLSSLKLSSLKLSSLRLPNLRPPNLRPPNRKPDRTEGKGRPARARPFEKRPAPCRGRQGQQGNLHAEAGGASGESRESNAECTRQQQTRCRGTGRPPLKQPPSPAVRAAGASLYVAVTTPYRMAIRAMSTSLRVLSFS